MAETKQKMDVRTYSRYVEKGLIKDADVNTHLKSLPDEADNAVWVDLSAEDSELENEAEEATEEAQESVEPGAHAQSAEEGT